MCHQQRGLVRANWATTLADIQVQYTDKKENRIFLIYEEIQKGSVAKSDMTNASSYMVKYFRSSSYIRKPFLIYDFATLNFLINEENFVFFFISVVHREVESKEMARRL